MKVASGKKRPMGHRPTGQTNGRRDLAICVALLVAVAAIYYPVGSFRFLTFDDEGYVFGNKM